MTLNLMEVFHICDIVKELGFKWKRSQGRRKVIIERYDIVDLRC